MTHDQEKDLNSALNMAIEMLVTIRDGGNYDREDYLNRLTIIRQELALSNTRLMELQS